MKYIEYCKKLLSEKQHDNKDYTYLRSEPLFIPFHRVDLKISKRRLISANLLEEMVLRLAEVGVDDLDTMSRILGVERGVLDITIGDLHFKDFAYHSSGKCIIQQKGRQILKSIKQYKREQDVIKGIYVNSVTGKICSIALSGVVNSSLSSDYLIKHSYTGDDLDEYRKQAESIQNIFEEQEKSNLPEDMKIADEFVSVDEVCGIYTCFLEILVDIYIEESGQGIDLIPKQTKYRQQFDVIREEIFSQILSGRLLSNLTVDKRKFKSYDYAEVALNQSKTLLDLNTMFETHQDQSELDIVLSDYLSSDRYLLDWEILDYCELLSSESKFVSVEIDQIEYWSRSSIFLNIIGRIATMLECTIYYANSYGVDSEKRALKRIIKQFSSNVDKLRTSQEMHGEWLKIVFDGKISIEMRPRQYGVWKSGKYIDKIIAKVTRV